MEIMLPFQSDNWCGSWTSSQRDIVVRGRERAIELYEIKRHCWKRQWCVDGGTTSNWWTEIIGIFYNFVSCSQLWCISVYTVAKKKALKPRNHLPQNLSDKFFYVFIKTYILFVVCIWFESTSEKIYWLDVHFRLVSQYVSVMLHITAYIKS